MSNPVVIKNAGEMQAQAREAVKASRSIGFVPTMGALHAGHGALLERARKENDVVVASIYVNPAQFGPGEDFHKYPRTFEADKELCAKAGVDFIFAPENLYEPQARTWVEVGELVDELEGLSRPGHFRGVATVVAKLLNIVQPDRLYLGLKDAQQVVVLRQMVRDLNFACAIVPCETVREPDGLALSSRNRYLKVFERKQALAISQALFQCRKAVEEGERDAMKLMGGMMELLSRQPDIEVDYVALVDAHSLQDLRTLKGDVLVAVAAKVGATRLIDNVQLKIK